MTGPEQAGGYWLWRDRRGDVEVRFAGRGEGDGREERAAVLAALEPSPPALAWARQVHSARALPARAGACGEGDALYTEEAGLALSVITADCVPVLLAGRRSLAAVHAGWRGIVASILEPTLAALSEPPAELTAWIGPAIGPCCYEVGHEVAEQVIAASHTGIMLPGRGERPHLDLVAAVRWQLERLGVREVRTVTACTRCKEEQLWSYRRQGQGAGRNVAFIWRRLDGQH